LDIGKAELVCCVRVPDPKGDSRRVQEVTTYSTMTRSLQVMADRLLDLGVTRVVMEATSSPKKPRFDLLEASSVYRIFTGLTTGVSLGTEDVHPRKQPTRSTTC